VLEIAVSILMILSIGSAAGEELVLPPDLASISRLQRPPKGLGA
jgi:hypothetical protein